ncbi:MAG TPA: APC family permease [Tepidisphaeraceae bacterium]|jgi:amino acid transporter|nr:APC family permease [Tepidisphaeraceae bacterium]
MSIAEQPLPAASKSESQAGGSLRHDSIGLLSTAALTAAYMGPAISIYALFGPMFSIVGNGVGFVMMIAAVLTLLSAISFGMLAKEIPSAGGVYAWARVALGESAGLGIGITSAIYYAICLIFPPIVFGQFFNELLREIGFAHTNYWTFLAGGTLMLVLAARVTYRGILVSSELALTLLLIELAVVVGLGLTFLGIAIKHGTFSLAPITLGACIDRWKGVMLALPLGLLCMACDAATPASEEIKNAKWTIPVAVVLTCAMIGLWYIVGFSGFAMGTDAKDMATLSDYISPIIPMAQRVWGPFRFLVALTAMSAAMGGFIPGATAASRVIYSMGREGKIFRQFGTVHPKTQTPWNALHLVYVAVLLVTIIPLWLVGADKTMEWWGFVFGWFVGLVYVVANLANIVFYWRFRRERFHYVWNLLVPGIAIIVQVFVIWQGVIVQLWASGTSGRSAQVFIATVTLATGIYVWRMSQRKER